ncbi:MAG: type II toxin-antitoxin system HicA family toxin [Anaerolineae bacterium]|nr:type II toxin-antitoxin system HicA family toxin [Anaerolineae bacterium]
MPKIPSVSARECIRAFEKAGFSVTRQSGSHVILHNGKGVRISIPEHNPVSKGVLRGAIKDAGLTVEEFITLLRS